MKGFRIVSLTAVIAGLCLAQCGFAQAAIGDPQADAAVDPTSGLPVNGYSPSKDVSIPVKATVAANCGFDPSAAPSGTVHAGDLNGTFDQFVNFGYHCALPVYVGVVSQNGSLKSPATPIPTGYTARRDYFVKLHLHGSSADNEGECLASSLATGGGCSFIGPATTTGGGLLGGSTLGAGFTSGSYLELHDPVYSGALVLVTDPVGTAPSYKDTLTVTLSAKM